MQLLRIRVPDFRVLKDVDIKFEKDFFPNIFPIGSQNGGGKSTLLQLIFVLLHCSINSERKDFLKNMLYGFKIPEKSHNRLLSVIEIWDREKAVKLEFISYHDYYLKNLLKANEQPELEESDYLMFSASHKLNTVINKIANSEQEIRELEKATNKLDSLRRLESTEERRYRLRDLMEELRGFGLRTIKTRLANIPPIEELQEEIQQRLDISKLNLEDYDEERKKLERILQKVSKYLQSENLVYICNYSSDGNIKEEEVLLCRIENIDMSQVNDFLEKLSQKAFLAAPASQVFLFISQESRKSLFKNQSRESDYYSHLQLAKSKLPGLFTYDFLVVSLLVEAFKAARDQDFREAIKTEGEYGKNYQKLLNDLNLILVNKKINLEIDFSGVNFKPDRENDNIKLYPEDLSHGELKRLSIYMWLRYNNIENAIVLIDEIEIALHPDWQYQIIKDLEQWSSSNQYILATHSYELCNALTPSHVKELEPKLFKSEAKSEI